MAKDPILSNEVAIDACDAVVDAIDTGGGAGILRIYAGSVPADADASVAGNTLLATLTFSATAFGAAADATGKATATANSITDDSSADATGTASFFRILKNDGSPIMQGTVGTSDADLVLDSVSITAGQTVSVSSLTISINEQA